MDSSSFAEALASETVRTPGTLCTVARIRDRLTTPDRATLDNALADIDTQTSVIGRALRGMGHDISDHTVARHRRGDCRCDR